RVRKSSFGVLSQVGNVQAGLALIPTYSKHPKLNALTRTLMLAWSWLRANFKAPLLLIRVTALNKFIT
ncbi:hypothetical protein, partial [Aerococcus sanguinicola]|uniref:hypothetical protein n=1 Tax=Aerococcus sanguinicola TaxID=119206 RepID=UPI001E316689